MWQLEQGWVLSWPGCPWLGQKVAYLSPHVSRLSDLLRGCEELLVTQGETDVRQPTPPTKQEAAALTAAIVNETCDAHTCI